MKERNSIFSSFITKLSLTETLKILPLSVVSKSMKSLEQFSKYLNEDIDDKIIK